MNHVSFFLEMNLRSRSKGQPLALASAEPVSTESLFRLICALLVSQVCSFCLITGFVERRLGKQEMGRSQPMSMVEGSSFF